MKNESYIKLAYEAKNKNQFQEAIDLFQQYIDKEKKDYGIVNYSNIAGCYEQIGLCFEKLNNILQAKINYHTSLSYNKYRADSYYYLAMIHKNENDLEECFKILLHANKIPFPEKEKLNSNFRTRPEIFNYLIDEEISILAFYVDKEYDVSKHFKKILVNHPSNFYNYINNLHWYKKSINEFLIEKHDLNNLTNISPNFHVSSPSIVKEVDSPNYLLNLRTVSYRIENGQYLPDKETGTIRTQNIFIKLDKNFQKLVEHRFDIPEPKRLVNGLEDIRIFYDEKNDLKFIGNEALFEDKVKMVYGDYNLNKDTLDFEILESPYGLQTEKNWSPFTYEGKNKILYNWSPFTIAEIVDGKLEVRKFIEKSIPYTRGGSPGFEYDGIIYFLVHFVGYGENNKREYYHSIIKIDATTLEYIDHSILFTFDNEMIEYGIGLIIEDDRVIITHSSNDCQSFIKIYNKEELFKFLF